MKKLVVLAVVVLAAAASSSSSAAATTMAITHDGYVPKTLRLRKLAARKFRVTVLAPDSFAGKFVRFQRYSSVRRSWITVRSAVLRSGSTLTSPINPTSVSTVTFRARISARLRVRAYLTQAQAGSCYAASASAAIRS